MNEYKIDYSYNWNYKKQYNNSPTEIILHHMAGYGDIFDVDRIHINNGWSGCGYHFIVMQNGVIYAGRPVSEIGAHCKGHNKNTIGICFEGNFENITMPAAQMKAGFYLLEYLQNKYKLNNIFRHKDYNATACPGKNFPYQKFVAEFNKNKKGGKPMEPKKYPHEYSKTARDWSVDEKLITGNGSDYGWTDNLTKEQLITILHRFYEKYILTK